MGIKYFFLLIQFFIFSIGFAQEDSLSAIDSFEIIFSGKKIANSKYNRMDLLDNRKYNTENLGYLINNNGIDKPKIFIVQPTHEIAEQFSNLLSSMIGAHADTGQLLLQLNNCKFSGMGENTAEGRYFSFSANLYKVTANGFCLIDEIDTIVNTKLQEYAYLVKKYHKAASKIITNFIARNLVQMQPLQKTCFTINEVNNIDSINKTQIDLYTKDTLLDGVYNSYISLKYQMPDYTEFRVKMKDGELKSVITNTSSTDDYLDDAFTNEYAVVKDNKIYIRFDKKYYLLEKRENDFFFNAKINVGAYGLAGSVMGNTGIVVGTLSNAIPLMGLGLLLNIGGQLATKHSKTSYEMLLNYNNGDFIPVKAVN